jgi:[acyl-carrier-protein] S-malonyltransferase
MAPAAARLKDYLELVSIKMPTMPVIHNIDARERDSVAAIRQALVEQADHPVLWVACMRRIADLGATMVAECGPGKVLAPMAKRIDERLSGVALVDRKSIDDTVSNLRGQA